MKKRRISLIILLLLLSAVCLASLTMAWKEYADQASDRHAFDELAELVEKPEETTVPATETESTDTAEDTTGGNHRCRYRAGANRAEAKPCSHHGAEQ